jgi:hypothetical protein
MTKIGLRMLVLLLLASGVGACSQMWGPPTSPEGSGGPGADTPADLPN